MSSTDFLAPVKAFLLEQGLGKTRANILARKLESKGGRVVNTLTDDTTHILVGTNNKLARVLALMKLETIPDGMVVLRADWLSACLTKKQLVSEQEYRLAPSESPQTTPTKNLKTGQSQAKKDLPGASKETSKNNGDDSGSSSDPAMHSPTAGMFSVSNRKWTSPSKTEEKMKARVAVRDSDSDYVESEEEEENTRISRDDNEAAGPPTKKVCRFCDPFSGHEVANVTHRERGGSARRPLPPCKLG